MTTATPHARAEAGDIASPEANSYILGGPHDVTVSVGPGLDGRLQVAYQDARTHLAFAGDEVTVDDAGPGRMVTVTVAAAPDLGSTTFTVVLPMVHLHRGQVAPVTAVAITAVHRAPLAGPVAIGQYDTYSTVALHGTASAVET